jgi:RHS repeat-associated protein
MPIIVNTFLALSNLFGNTSEIARHATGRIYLNGDRLGSLTLMTDSSGALVADSMARFLPFGEYRSSGSQPVDGNDLSDRGFTGHYENRGIGLTYMQARYYARELRRFISADTLVPDPGASIGYNRFAYVNQNPLNLFDPTGHCGADISPHALDDCENLKADLESEYLFLIEGEWLHSELVSVKSTIDLLLQVFAQQGVQDTVSHLHAIWGGTTLARVREDPRLGSAITVSDSRIEFFDIAFYKPEVKNKELVGALYQSEREPTEIIETIVHELAHIWDRRTDRQPSEDLRNDANGRFRWVGFFQRRYVSDMPPPNAPINQGRRYWNHREDWAYSFALYIVDQSQLSATRAQYIDRVIGIQP